LKIQVDTKYDLLRFYERLILFSDIFSEIPVNLTIQNPLLAAYLANKNVKGANFLSFASQSEQYLAIEESNIQR
jgi:hypothetical protein